MNELAQFLSYVTKVFALNRIVRGVRSDRPYAEIPTRPLLLSLLLGVVIRAGSYLDISKQTASALAKFNPLETTYQRRCFSLCE